MTSLGAGLRDLAASATSVVDTTVNETLIRLAVTGLSRAGKTVFITSLIRNLLALGQGRGTLPQLQACLETDAGSRLKHVRVLPAGAAAIPSFDYSAKFAELASETPSWPPRTDDLAQIGLDIEVERNGTFWRKLGPRRIRLEILDYPGEWLLDLPLLTRSYATWSAETLALLRRSPRDSVFAEFLGFLGAFDPHGPVADELIQRGHALYRRALQECRGRFGLCYLQPGRFLCPGPRRDPPFMSFFPIDQAGTEPARHTVGALLGECYELYKADIRATFFDTHFANFDRQIVLVDVLSALHAGKEAFDDTARAIKEITVGLGDGWGFWSRKRRQSMANSLSRYAGPTAGRLAANGGWAAAVPLALASVGLSLVVAPAALGRIAFVATKADHVPTMRRDNLRNLLRALVEPAKEELRQRPVTYHAAAAVLSTEDGTAMVEGRPVEVVYGVPLGEEQARPFYPGEVPSARPPESFWSKRYFELPVFKPPQIDPTGATGIAHLGLDEVLTAVLKDVL